jgi:hypothetical protein
MKYSIVLLQTKDKLYPGYFNNLVKDEMLFVRTVETDSTNLYALGVFYNRPDAVTYLGYLREVGLKDAYIINQYDLDSGPKQLTDEAAAKIPALTRRVFTIQLRAARSPIDINRLFPGYKGVKEIVGDDGYYKYVFGEFTSIAKAKEALIDVQKDFEDAFIREINVLEDK